MWIEAVEDRFWEEPFESVRINLDGGIGVAYDGTDLSIIDRTDDGKGNECWLRLTPQQLAQIARELQAIQQEQFCPECGGLGNLESHYGAEDHEYDLVQCPDCGGTGKPKEREAEPCQKF